jgi:hypothetical protein
LISSVGPSVFSPIVVVGSVLPISSVSTSVTACVTPVKITKIGRN